MKKNETIRITKETFRNILEKWGKHISIEFSDIPPYRGCWHSLHITNFTEYFWSSFKNNNVDELWEHFTLRVQVYNFSNWIYDMLSQNNSISIKEMLYILARYEELSSAAREQLKVSEKFKNVAEQFEEILQNLVIRPRRPKQYTIKVGRRGRPVTTHHIIDDATKLWIFRRDHFQCVYCGAEAKPEPLRNYKLLSIDHIIPGINSLDNLAVSCKTCNSYKSNFTPKERGLELKYGRFHTPNNVFRQP